MNPRAELEKRYPKADFGKLAIYFAHLAACKAVKNRGITNLNCALCASQISVIIEVL